MRLDAVCWLLGGGGGGGGRGPESPAAGCGVVQLPKAATRTVSPESCLERGLLEAGRPYFMKAQGEPTPSRGPGRDESRVADGSLRCVMAKLCRHSAENVGAARSCFFPRLREELFRFRLRQRLCGPWHALPAGALARPQPWRHLKEKATKREIKRFYAREKYKSLLMETKVPLSQDLGEPKSSSARKRVHR